MASYFPKPPKPSQPTKEQRTKEWREQRLTIAAQLMVPMIPYITAKTSDEEVKAGVKACLLIAEAIMLENQEIPTPFDKE